MGNCIHFCAWNAILLCKHISVHLSVGLSWFSLFHSFLALWICSALHHTHSACWFNWEKFSTTGAYTICHSFYFIWFSPPPLLIDKTMGVGGNQSESDCSYDISILFSWSLHKHTHTLVKHHTNNHSILELGQSELPYTESDQWFIYLSIVYTDCWGLSSIWGGKLSHYIPEKPDISSCLDLYICNKYTYLKESSERQVGGKRPASHFPVL